LSNNIEEREKRASIREEHELIRRAMAGDVDAYGSLVRNYQQKILNLAGRMVGRRDIAEDLVQEVFIKAFRKLGSFRFESSFYTWLYTIALNTCRNYYRKRVPETIDVNDEMNAAVVERASPGEAADEVIYRRQRAEIIRAAIDRLAPEQKEVIVLCDLEGLGYQEIADLLGIPIGTVRSRIFRARFNLRGLLPEDIVGGE
jgi:RNA polymerase sigma-70 factor (ECF subfamily)